jgi:hypothetical protein
MPGSDDPGLRVVRHVYQTMQIDAGWSTWSPRGFTWWGHELAQRVWSDGPYVDHGETIYRVHAETDFLRGAPDARARQTVASLMGLTGLSGAYHDPASDVLRLRTSASVHAQNEAWLRVLFGHAAAIQTADAQAQASVTARVTGLTPATSAHPVSGLRSRPDEMLAFVEGIVQPTGAGPSRWRGSPEFGQVADLLTRNGVPANGDPTGLTAEFGFGANPGSWIVGGDSALLEATLEAHPRYGNGLHLRLTLPVSQSATDQGALPLSLNARERDARDSGHFFGSWCISPFEKRPYVTFVGFLPNLVYQPGLLLNLALSTWSRAKWADGLLGSTDSLRRGHQTN